MRNHFLTRASLVAPLLLTGLAAGLNCSHGPADQDHSSSSSGSGGSASSGSGGSSSSSGDAGVPFQADPAAVYVAKVKNLLVGTAPTDAEIQQVAADPTQLKALIGQWQQLPGYSLKMRAFFEQAFQQTQVTATDFIALVPGDGLGQGAIINNVVENAIESFARTVQVMNAAGQPFTNTMTTTSVMMTPPLMELYAFMDTYQVDDNGKIDDTFAKDFPGVDMMQSAKYGVTSPGAADPTSPDFMHWYDPDLPKLTNGTYPACNALDPIVYYPGGYYPLLWMLFGGTYTHAAAVGGKAECGGQAGLVTATTNSQYNQFTVADFGESAWKMVNIAPTDATHPRTRFWDIPGLRATSTLYLDTPHVGFFSTPAFFANWPTNMSNQMRVTANQALIVATGAQVDGSDPTTLPLATALDAGLDEGHAAPGTPCYGCHQLLDPTRAILSSTYSYGYYQQLDPTMISANGVFAFQGVVQPVSSVAEFGATLASHPLFKSAWVQKLCYYANSTPCLTTDPEFQRIVDIWVTADYSWDALVAELFSSPLTTNAAPTPTTQSTETVSVTRRDHLCAALDLRLGLSDVCGLSPNSTTSPNSVVAQIANGLPSDGYGRGATIPVLPTLPTLFYRSGVENICAAVAAMVIDPAAGSLPAGATSWSSKDPATAIAGIVSTMMAVEPSDARSGPIQTILLAHYQGALGLDSPVTNKAYTATQALESTFVAACVSPSFTGIGM